MKRDTFINTKTRVWLALLVCSSLFVGEVWAAKNRITALYIPLADHYAAIVAYEDYRHRMKHASFVIEKMSSWDLLRAKFQRKSIDMAFVMSPLLIDMYSENPDLKWMARNWVDI